LKPFLIFLAVLLSVFSRTADAQTADAIFQQACGPKEAAFNVQQVKTPPPAAPDPGKALVYVIQKQSGTDFITRFGLDGAWAGVILRDSYISVSVAPGEHHACVAAQDRKHPQTELLHFTAEAGKTYYYLVRGIAAAGYSRSFAAMEFGPADRDEALFLITSDPKSVAMNKP
jgi:hypothetical protein